MPRMTEKELMERYKAHVMDKEYTLAISKDGEPCELAGKAIEDLITVEGALVAVTNMGLYQLIPDEEMTMMYVRNDPRFVEVSDDIIVNLGNVTKVESDSRRIWMGDQAVCGDESYWTDFISKYDLYRQGKLSG
ncbi:hypothetical protein [Paenibacillus apiarius]|uniref:hypothetical protein n=1 Tax=Paenibacillus apiarius TaxID=46240 RepID=UPI003B3B2F98